MRTLLTAHSGCDHTPDNSLEYIRYALNMKIDSLEVDVRRNQRGDLILAHDADAGGTVFLQDVFSVMANKPHIKINCDLKEPDLEWQAWQLAEAEGVTRQLIYSGQVDDDAMQRLPEKGKSVDWYFNMELLYPHFYRQTDWAGRDDLCQDIAQSVRRRFETSRAACLNVHYQICRTPLWRHLRSRAILLSLWTPDEVDDLKRFLAEGVFNLTTRNVMQAQTLLP